MLDLHRYPRTEKKKKKKELGVESNGLFGLLRADPVIRGMAVRAKCFGAYDVNRVQQDRFVSRAGTAVGEMDVSEGHSK